MAGENPLPIQECPDDWQTITISCQPDADGFISNNQVLHYCERDTVVDAAFIRMTVGDNDATWTLEQCTNGTAPASGTDMSTALTHALSLNNQVSSICLDVATAASTAFRCNVTLRVRTRIR